MTAQDQIFKYIEQHPGCIIIDILDYTKINYQMVKFLLTEMIRSKQIHNRRWWIKPSFDHSTWRWLDSYTVHAPKYTNQPVLFDDDTNDSAIG